MLRSARQVQERGSPVHVAQLAVVAALWAAELPTKAQQHAAAELELTALKAALAAAPSEVADAGCLQEQPAGAALDAPAARRRVSELRMKVASLAAAPQGLWPLQQVVVVAVAQPSATREALYSYTLQQLDEFPPGHLIGLLYALHKLSVQPPPKWLAAVVDRRLFKPHHMQQLTGQDLAALVQALSGCNYDPRPAVL
eukprot:gene10082-10237_t